MSWYKKIGAGQWRSNLALITNPMWLLPKPAEKAAVIKKYR